jgi:hypothetical protein
MRSTHLGQCLVSFTVLGCGCRFGLLYGCPSASSTPDLTGTRDTRLRFMYLQSHRPPSVLLILKCWRPAPRRRLIGLLVLETRRRKSVLWGSTVMPKHSLARSASVFSRVEIFLLSSSNQEVPGGPVSRSLCHAAIHEL